MFIKAVPVAIVPAQYLPKLIPPKTLAKVKQLAGQVDSTSYSDEYEGKGMYIFQMKDGRFVLEVENDEFEVEYFYSYDINDLLK
jgi:hypothetical protein